MSGTTRSIICDATRSFSNSSFEAASRADFEGESGLLGDDPLAGKFLIGGSPDAAHNPGDEVLLMLGDVGHRQQRLMLGIDPCAERAARLDALPACRFVECPRSQPQSFDLAAHGSQSSVPALRCSFSFCLSQVLVMWRSVGLAAAPVLSDLPSTAS